MSEREHVGREHRWPDDVQMGDRLEIDGHTYEVVGTGPAEASLERTDDESVEVKVFRWAVTGDVGFQMTKTISQQEFEHSLHMERDP